jgi:hypothetical protein
MLDALFLAIVAGFALLTWALIVLCDRLMGGGQ